MFWLRHKNKTSVMQSYLEVSYVISSSICGYDYEPPHEMSNNVVCTTSIGSDQPAHTRSLIRAFDNSLIIILISSY